MGILDDVQIKIVEEEDKDEDSTQTRGATSIGILATLPPSPYITTLAGVG